ncbi:hypothetical protein GUITHDRAFT_158560 [Guillardia theta CCMP2712]|uniref:Serine aminopeptidase S33 domain-containing protein n=2 Tax=Guillardia theta TaxID=55529 RepID=L1IPR6_GUITC|nr:hypothetical protein GUITHDRAFT_158560 [Guillardia theta CCMP2712]EKX37795.1 hypothetical protein GUITHDRAFT_158560 [Guillardia theta CCMP2712]|eukprot:XP_005824775.1 hypothetical protein GUITHDRAFT_158560 [Guillardia theta CCMP2712]
MLEKLASSTTDEYFTSSRGLRLFTRTMTPTDPPRGAILICHGYGDHLRWFLCDTMVKFVEAGFVVTGLEMEGHGWSDGNIAMLDNFELALQDVFEYLKHMQKKFSELRWLIFGESMGGMVAIRASIEAQKQGWEGEPVHGAILQAPMCTIAPEMKPSEFMVGALRVLSHIIPSVPMVPSDISVEKMIRRPDMLAVGKANPLCYVGLPRLATARELYDATLKLDSEMEQMKTPFLVLHGSADVITNIEGSRALHARAGCSPEKKTIKVYEDAWHALTSGEPEPVNGEVWRDILEWAQANV